MITKIEKVQARGRDAVWMFVVTEAAQTLDVDEP